MHTPYFVGYLEIMAEQNVETDLVEMHKRGGSYEPHATHIVWYQTLSPVNTGD
ncbi:MAG: hypothetical protein OEM38_08290 [Gammaproteobacteria bacterium]|nr:hypothetical protein [Gammaproteobacteria bacterium]